jgi:hypothetical protein
LEEAGTRGGMKNTYKILVIKSEGKKPFGRRRGRWDDDDDDDDDNNNNKVDVKAIRIQVIDWTRLAPKRDQWQTFVNMAMNFRVA